MKPVHDLTGQVVGYLNDAEEFIPAKDSSPDTTLALAIVSSTHTSLIQKEPVSVSVLGSNAKDSSLDAPAKDFTLDVAHENTRLTSSEESCAGQPAESPAKNLSLDSPAASASPVPTGEAFDDLLDECCLVIERWWGTSKKLDPDFWVEDGQHSLILMTGRDRLDIRRGHDGVKSWIEQGTLRATQKLKDVMTAFCESMATKVRRRLIDPDWLFDRDCMAVIGTRFGLPGPTTLAELKKQRAVDDAQWEKEQEERQRRDREVNKRMEAELEQSIKDDARVEREAELLRKITNDFFTMDDLDLDGDSMPPEYHKVTKKRNDFKKFNRTLISTLIDQGRSNSEIEDYAMAITAITKGNFHACVPDPLQPGETRHYVKPEEMKEYIDRMHEGDFLVTHRAGVVLAMDGRFCVTIRKKTDEEIAASNEIAAAVAGK